MAFQYVNIAFCATFALIKANSSEHLDCAGVQTWASHASSIGIRLKFSCAHHALPKLYKVFVEQQEEEARNCEDKYWTLYRKIIKDSVIRFPEATAFVRYKHTY